MILFKEIVESLCETICKKKILSVYKHQTKMRRIKKKKQINNKSTK